jgi:hypothetical protein
MCTLGRERRGKYEREDEKGGAAAITEETRKWYRMETPGGNLSLLTLR